MASMSSDGSYGGSPAPAPGGQGSVRSRAHRREPGAHPGRTPEPPPAGRGSVQGRHQTPPQALSERVLGDESLELSDQLVVVPEREVGVDPGLRRRQPDLLEPGDGGLGEALVGEVRERRAPPERQRLAEPLRRARPPGRDASRLLPFVHQPLEAVEIELVRARPGRSSPAIWSSSTSCGSALRSRETLTRNAVDGALRASPRPRARRSSGRRERPRSVEGGAPASSARGLDHPGKLAAFVSTPRADARVPELHATGLRGSGRSAAVARLKTNLKPGGSIIGLDKTRNRKEVGMRGSTGSVRRRGARRRGVARCRCRARVGDGPLRPPRRQSTAVTMSDSVSFGEEPEPRPVHEQRWDRLRMRRLDHAVPRSRRWCSWAASRDSRAQILVREARWCVEDGSGALRPAAPRHARLRRRRRVRDVVGRARRRWTTTPSCATAAARSRETGCPTDGIQDELTGTVSTWTAERRALGGRGRAPALICSAAARRASCGCLPLV